MLPDGAVMNLPRWDDEKLNLGSMVRVALWLATVVREGNTFTKQDLRDAFPGVAQIDRRMRDLRDYDWTIATTREDPTLAAEEFRLVRTGVPVWNAASRAKSRMSTQIQRNRPQAGIALLDYALPTTQTKPGATEMVWKQVAGLTHDDKVLVLAWLVKGHRDHTPAEKAFDAAQMLPAEARQALMTKLADDLVGRIKETPSMTD